MRTCVHVCVSVCVLVLVSVRCSRDKNRVSKASDSTGEHRKLQNLKNQKKKPDSQQINCS